MTDKTFCRFGPFFAFLTPPPHNNPKNQNFENIKQTSKDIMILHMSTKNDNPMMYGYGMVPEIVSAIDRIFCHFGPFFALIPP